MYLQLKKVRLRKSTSEAAAAINLWDNMGFEESVSPAGPTMRDMEYIMDGHIMDEYQVGTQNDINIIM